MLRSVTAHRVECESRYRTESTPHRSFKVRQRVDRFVGLRASAPGRFILPAAAMASEFLRIPLAATDEVNRLCLIHEQAGHSVIRLGQGESPFPVPRPCVEAAREHAYEKRYQHPAGIVQLTHSIGRYLERTYGISSENQVLVGPGLKPVIDLLMAALKIPVISIAPGWVTYGPLAILNRREFRRVETSFEQFWHPDLEVLERTCIEMRQTTASHIPILLLLTHPGNPEGLIFETDQLVQIAALARKYNLLIGSDEVYSELTHNGQHVSMAKVCPERTFFLSGLSKGPAAAGWRIGFVSIPPIEIDGEGLLFDILVRAASHQWGGTNLMAQYGAIPFYEGGAEIDQYLFHVRRILAANGNYLAAQLQNAGLRVHNPNAGFYLFPDFSAKKEQLARRGIHTSEELALAILNEEYLGMIPGSAFGLPPDKLAIRIAYRAFNGTRAFEESLKHDTLPADFIEQYCKPIPEACDRIIRWLERV